VGDGYYRMRRGWTENRLFRGEPFCRAAAWCWLIGEAVHAGRELEVAGRTIVLQRGQLSHSLRFLAAAWSWEIGRVQRFTSALATDSMIDIATDSGQMVITICNYDKYQLRPTEPIQGSIQLPIQEEAATRFKNQKDSSSGSKEPSEGSLRSQRAREPAASARILADFAEWWGAYPHQVGKPAAARAYAAALARAGPAEMLGGLRRYVAAKPPDRQWLNPATFLNQDRWLDQPAMLLPITGGRDGATRKLSPNEKLFAGFAAAAGIDCGVGGPADEPLLDRRRSA
jgi:hypothetical protein